MHVLTASNDDTARIWDLEDGRLVANLSAGVAVQTAEFSPDGKTIATASANDDHSMAQVWDAGSGKLLRTLPEQKATVTTAVFSPTGTRLVTANNNGTAQVWNAADGRPLLALQGYSAAFSPSGRQIVTALGVGLDLWDAENGRLLATLSDELPGMISEPPSPDRISVSTGAFSPDGKRIVAVTGGVTLWQDGHLANAGLDGDVGDKAYSAAFSPDGKRVVVASGSDHTARVWDANAEGRLLATLSGHTDEVLDAAFSPDGKRIITASKDRTARVWDATTDSPLATFSGHTDKVSTAKFSRDGKRIVTASADGTAKVYLVDFDELLKRAKQDLPINRGN
jgi:WD40 repeat protein